MLPITCTLNGVKVKKQIPTRWSEITFAQYLELFETLAAPEIDNAKVLSILTGIDEKTLATVKIEGLETVLNALSFMRTTPMDLSLPKSILGYALPKDLAFESTGQYADAQAISNTLPRPEKPGEVPKWTRADMAKYADIVAIFAWGMQYHDSTEEQKQAFASKFLNAPAEEVLAVGNFTLLKLVGLRLNIKADSPKRSTAVKRWTQAIRIWVLNTGFSLRYWLLKRRLGLTGKGY